MSKTVIVTGIGGNVGQGILRNIRRLNYDLKIIGTNISTPTVANHLCDEIVKVPYAFDENYISVMSSLAEEKKVDLIVPSTDFESLILSKHEIRLPEVACSPYDTCRIFVDKFETFKSFSDLKIPFVTSILPSEYNGQYEPIIVKPREGRGSRNIHFNPANWRTFDDTFMVQELVKGKELTSAFYVDKYGVCKNKITFERYLENGATVVCRVVHHADEELQKIIDSMISNFNIEGSCNIQYIYNEQGIHPFEINCRISGTNSIRSHFGFDDVKWTIEERLFNKPVDKALMTTGSATRMLMDIIMPDTDDLNTIEYGTNYFIF